jgi:CRISPR-associated protein Csx10
MTALPRQFEVRLQFLSDWHVGTGEGRLAGVDAVVRRDVDGMPFVPAKTLVGVWRDACETVADTLDRAGPARPWARWVDWLFGSQPARRKDATTTAGEAPRPAVLSLGPARMPESLLAGLRGRPALRAAAVTLRPGVSIDEKTGTAREDFLRLEERASRGSVLETTVLVETGGASLPAAAELLLRAGARMIDAVGGKRNRGAGRVAVLLPAMPAVDPLAGAGADVPLDPRLTTLMGDTALLADPGDPPATPTAVASHPAGSLAGTDRTTLRVVLRVVTPVVVADGVLGNIITTRGEIPGTMLLGTVLAHLDRVGGVGLADVRVGDAVPAVPREGAPGGVEPARPAPLVWQRSGKGEGPVVYNTTIEGPRERGQAKPVPGRVTRVAGTSWRQVRTEVAVSTHAVIDDEARRPTTTGGGVFTYLGIPPGTVLASDVTVPADAQLTFTPGEVLRFGRSRKDDFGRVEVVSVSPVDPAPWPPSAGEGPRELRVWCVSDVLLRDERLAPDPSPHRLATVLGDIIGDTGRVTLRAVTIGAAPAGTAAASAGDLRPTVVETARREGFVRNWGQPRVSQIGLRAGSTVTLAVVDGVIDPAKVAQVQRDGIGERTAEGFGRILLDPPELAVARPDVHRDTDGDADDDREGTDNRDGSYDDEAPLASAPALTDASGLPDGAPHPLEVAAWRQAVRRNAAIAALEPEKVLPGIGTPSRAQLGALRGQLERLALPGGEDPVRQWFAATDAVEQRRTQWGPALEEAQQLLLGDEQRVWRVLDLDGPRPGLVLAAGREPLVRESLRREALTVLVGEVLRQVRATPRTGPGAGPDLSPDHALEPGSGYATEPGLGEGSAAAGAAGEQQEEAR